MAKSDGHVKIATEVDSSGLKVGLKESEKTAKKTFEELAKESGRTVDELKTDAKKIAEEYQKQGYNIPNSYKKAYSDMGIASNKAKKQMKNDAEEMGDSHKKNSNKTKRSWEDVLSGIGSFAQKGFSIMGSAAVAASRLAIGAIAGVSTALGAVTAAGLKYNSTIEGYQTSFEVMTGSAEKAVEVTEKLKNIGAATPFELADLADTTQLLMNYGFTADDAIDRMTMLGDISQGSADKMSRIAMAYGQMSSAGKVSLEDVKQMIEAGFNPLQEISESTGESMESLYERISDGDISVDEITASMQRATSEGGKYYKSMEKQSQTMEGLISTMKDNALALAGDVIQPISEEITSNLLPSAIGALEELSTAFSENGIEGLIETGAGIVSDIILGMSEQLPTLVNMATSIVSNLITNIKSNTPQIMQAGAEILASLLTGLAKMIPSLLSMALEMVFSFALALTKPNTLINIINAGIELLLGLVTGLTDAIPKLLEIIPTIIANLAVAIIAEIPQLLLAATEIMLNLGKFMVLSVSNLLEAVPKILSEIKSAFLKLDYISIGENIIDGITQGVKQAASNLVDAAVNAAKNAVEAVKKWLGIASPSKLMRDLIGKNMIAGIGVGFEEETPNMIRTGKQSVSKVVSGMQSKAFGVYPEYRVGNETKNIDNDSPNHSGGNTWNINFYREEESPDETARAIQKVFEFGLAGAD